MKQLFTLALLVLSFQSFARELVIISDLDETLRVANVEHHFKAGLKLIGGVKPYEGMQHIFAEIKAKNPDAKFYYLSNSYPFLYNGERWTDKYDFPDGVVFQRSLKDKSAEFKPRKLKEIAAAHPDAELLMFGDNIEHDPKFYREFLAETQREARVFIRDARLEFTEEPGMTYFQTENQITDDLLMSEETTAAVRGLPFNKLVPKFLLKNLKKRLIETCKSAPVTGDCREEADLRVQSVISQIKPQSDESIVDVDSTDEE